MYFQIKARMGKDVVSLRSAGNLHDKAPPSFFYESRKAGRGEGEGCGLNVNGRSNVNSICAFAQRGWRGRVLINRNEVPPR